MSEIIPAILPTSEADLKEKASLVGEEVPHVHIDVLPDTFLPHELNLRVNFEAHLMVGEPQEIMDEWVKAGAERIIVHVESLKNGGEIKESLLDVELGLAIELDTPLSALEPFIAMADFIHLMSIRHIGKQGEPLDEAIYERIKEVRVLYPNVVLSVDGGVNESNAETLIEAGVERLVVGSAIFGKDNPKEALEDLISLTQ